MRYAEDTLSDKTMSEKKDEIFHRRRKLCPTKNYVRRGTMSDEHFIRRKITSKT